MTPALLYQDDDLIAVGKPEDLASIPEHDREKENLQTNAPCPEGTHEP